MKPSGGRKIELRFIKRLYSVLLFCCNATHIPLTYTYQELMLNTVQKPIRVYVSFSGSCVNE